jgi:hypothetical protein
MRAILSLNLNEMSVCLTFPQSLKFHQTHIGIEARWFAG